MKYRHAPYALRYAVAVTAWAVIVSVDLILRVLFLPAMPFFWLATGFGQTQMGAQMNVNLVEFYTRPLMRMPLLRRSGSRSADKPAKPGLIQVIR
jgi:hypothetical protein